MKHANSTRLYEGKNMTTIPDSGGAIPAKYSLTGRAYGALAADPD